MKLTLLFIISGILLSAYKNKYQRRPLKNSTYVNSFYQKGNNSIIYASVTGNKQFIPHKIKKIFKNLQIFHLFTPSGIHFSSILLIISPLFKIIKGKLSTILKIVILSSSFFIPGVYSIHRIATLLILKQIFKKVSFQAIFGITFLIHLLFTFRYSPLSYAMSMLFIGIFIFSKKKLLPLMFNLLIGNLIIGLIFQQNAYLLAIPFGLILTSIYSVFFPIFFVSYAIQWNLLLTINSYLIDTYLLITKFFYIFLKATPPINITLFLVITLISLNYFKSTSVKKVILFLYFMMSSSPIINFPTKKYLTTPATNGLVIKKEFIHKIFYDSIGIRVVLKNNKTCLIKIYNSFYKTRCQK